MGPRRLLTVPLLVVLAWPAAAAQDAAVPVPPVDKDPMLRLEGRGPLSPVEAVALGADGAVLYEAGWDKVVRVWRRDARTRQFTLDPPATLRVPIGPGDAGVLNALAVSADGAWLAVGGNAVLPEAAGFRQVGLMVPREGAADPLAQGVVYVFDLRANPPTCRQLRGHQGPVWALAFAATPPGRSPVLLSAGSEPDPQEPGSRLLKLRLWDVAARTELGQAECGRFSGARPWLAASSLAPDHHRVRAAAAWTNSFFLVWDVGVAPPTRVDDPHSRGNDQGQSTVLSYLPQRGLLLTGHFGIPPVGKLPEGFLDTWEASTPTHPTQSSVVSWAAGRPALPPIKAIPVAQALVSSQRGGPPDLLAVVLRSWTPQDRPETLVEYRLQLLDLSPARFGSVRAQAALWSGPRVKPFVASAAAPDGGWLAIAGNPENEILVHSVASLLQGRPALQRLRGAGEPVEAATFVRHGADDWGLLIRHTPRAGPDDRVFDLTNRRFAPSPAGWTAALPALDDWQTLLKRPYREAPERHLYPGYFWIYQGQKPVGPGIRILPDGESAGLEDVQVTAHALLPPGRAAVPIAAIAAYEPLVGPTLRLYNGNTGVRFRQLSGHTGRIGSLAFSRDGRFLVSAAADRTVCVWSLTDLDEILQKRAALPGLGLTRKNGRYEVATLLRDSPYLGRADLRVGDVIDGYLEGPGRLRELGSSLDLHYVAAVRRPDQVLSLRRRRDGQGAQDIALTLGQLIDERKPLLTLFVARAGPGNPLEWLAWNPTGPYDSSGPGIASFFGWHFNAPDRPEAPARFALAASYPMFRREGLLRDLIRDGRLRPPPAPPPVVPTDLQLFLDPVGQSRGDVLVVRQPPTMLTLELDDRVPPERIESAAWRLDRGPAQAMQADQQSWTADLSGIPWDRETHELTVAVRVREPASRSFLKRLRVCYVPRPPHLHIQVPQDIARAPGTRRLEVDDPRFRFAADVEPTRGENARARLIHRHGDQVVFQGEYGPDRAAWPHLDLTLELQPGDNTIELELVNAGARDGFRDEEMERFGPLSVHFRPRPVEPPIIQLDSLVLLPAEESAPSGTIPIKGMEPCIIETTPRVLVRGRITAKDRLTRAELRSVDKDGRTLKDWKALDGFTAGLRETFDIKAEIDLVPDHQIISLRAQAGNDLRAEATPVVPLTITYHPTLPGLKGLAVDPAGPILQVGTGSEPDPVVKLTADIEGAPERIDRADVLLNGQPPAHPLTIDRRARKLFGSIRLSRGLNEISGQLSNRWHSAPFGPIRVEYRRPPRIEQFDARVPAGRPLAQLSARVASLSALTRAEIRVVHQRANGPDAPPQVARWEPRGEADWGIRAEVPLEPGTNEVILQTWNEDGPSPEKRVGLVYQKPVEPKPDPPVLSVETPVEDQKARPVVPLRFRVRSTSPLTRVELIPEPVPSQRFELGQLGRGPDGAYEFHGDREIPLEIGTNSFQLEAENAGGVSRAHLSFSYVPPPQRVVIDGVEPRRGGKSQVPRGRVDGPPVIPEPLPDSAIVLHGRVIWSQDTSLNPDRDSRVQVWVNGFPHVAVSLEDVADRPRERSFHAEVLLGRLENNEIDLRLDGRPLENLGDLKLFVSCRDVKANANWRLHLLVIGVGPVDRKALRDRAIEAIKGSEFDEKRGTFKTPAFPTARFYGFAPEDPDIQAHSVRGKLREIKHRITMRPTRPSKERLSNDVVILYYQGEVIEGKESSLRLRRGTDASSIDRIRLSEIKKALGETPEGSETQGAKLFLLDVTRAPSLPLILARDAQWIQNPPPFGLLRFSGQEQPITPNDSLVATMRTALQEKKITLEEVSAEVDRRSQVLRNRYPNLRYVPELNRYFNRLVLGGP